ncbi:DUF2846 domain-containing protein [Paraneptunicella aestuarii]|uniref:DUF2846 domain-containing protein n=1 Tax=Paraneptunicella aestuarii TaxID=2831148 RepID=UPI001E3CE42F|nr:DUF2846 domain-containing protein [Paraneptunicella aestuarii]UAA40379.1 DUF2846 domain-containing protein [Paraneptunicella aestuarii]
MKKRLSAIAITFLALSGCATVPTVSQEETNKAKQFDAPSEGNAGIYVYRINSAFGGALKKDVWLNGKCVGETAPGIFFYEEVAGNREHTLSTESEFSPNSLMLEAESGKNYFVEQYIKMGAFVGGAGLKVVDATTGKNEVTKLDMARQGRCSN